MSDTLRKGPELTSTYTQDIVFTDSARQAWECAIRTIQHVNVNDLCILLPAYIGQTDREGSGIFDPIRNTKVRYKFYALDEKLKPDLNAIRQAIESSKIDVLLIVHYFGFQLCDMLAIQKLCSENSVCLIEDCAHVCFSVRDGLGSYGDFSFYSLHKFFPTESGGVLRINQNEWVEFANENANQLECSTNVLQQLLRTDLDQVRNHRIECFRHLASALSSNSKLKPLYDAEDLKFTSAPHNFPIVIADDQREPLYFWLNEQGFVTIALYYQMIDELSSNEFPLSFSISNSILNLPVHQDTSIKQLDALTQKIGEYFG